MREAKESRRFAGRVNGLRPSAVREMLKATESPRITSFAGGLPAADLFPVADLAAICQTILADDATGALQYTVTEGFLPLRQWVCRHVEATGGIRCAPEEVLITTGSQQALDLAARTFLDPGDVVVAQDPSYVGALQVFAAYETRTVGVSSDSEGMCPDALRHVVLNSKEPPKLLYLVTNFQNPTGLTTSARRRRELADIAAEFDVLVLEDDPYGRLRYSGADLSPLVTVAERSNCIYLGTSSKILAPGLRVAWMVVPDTTTFSKLVAAKQTADLHTAGFTQRIVARYCDSSEGFERHLSALVAAYRQRRDTMHAAMNACFPEECNWSLPDGGLFFWVKIPQGLDATTLLKTAIAKDVAFVPGAAFCVSTAISNAMRLNFSNASPTRIEEGIARLGTVLKEALYEINRR
jgi:2-aminoadipate transaminase